MLDDLEISWLLLSTKCHAMHVIYKAQGSNASWEWLSMISPCIGLLRKLALQMNASLGARLGDKHHSPSLERDLASLQDSMRQHSIFKVELGRHMPGVTKGEVPNVVTEGLNALPGPLADYNRAFEQLQRRLRGRSIFEMAASPPSVDGVSQSRNTGESQPSTGAPSPPTRPLPAGDHSESTSRVREVSVVLLVLV